MSNEILDIFYDEKMSKSTADVQDHGRGGGTRRAAPPPVTLSSGGGRLLAGRSPHSRTRARVLVGPAGTRFLTRATTARPPRPGGQYGDQPVLSAGHRPVRHLGAVAGKPRTLVNSIDHRPISLRAAGPSRIPRPDCTGCSPPGNRFSPPGAAVLSSATGDRRACGRQTRAGTPGTCEAIGVFHRVRSPGSRYPRPR